MSTRRIRKRATGRGGAADAAAPRPLRVCHLAYSFYEVDNRVMRYAELLASVGADVEVIGLRRPDQGRHDRLNGVALTRLQRRNVTERSAASYLLKLLWFLLKCSVVMTHRHIRRPYDVVHVHNVPDFLVFAALVPRLTGARVLLDIHDVLPELFGGKFGASSRSLTFRALLLVERASCRMAHHVIVANHIWEQRVSERSVQPGRCSTFLNYPDRLFFVERDASPNAFVFLYPGSLNRHQGLDLAVDAFALAADEMPTAELHIYGDGPERQELVAQAARLGLSARVLVRDKVPLKSVPTLMAAARVGIVPKRASGFGNEAFSTKVFEFMACGVPTIVSRTRIDQHYFDDSCVTFFTSDDVVSLADAMRKLYRNPAAASAQAARASEVVKRWSWEAHGERYLALVSGNGSAGVLDSECPTS